jgi:hypothetical protein
LFENLHAVVKVTKITEDIAIDALHAGSPIGGKFSHQALHDFKIDVVLVGCGGIAITICVVVVTCQTGFGLLDKGDQF